MCLLLLLGYLLRFWPGHFLQLLLRKLDGNLVFQKDLYSLFDGVHLEYLASSVRRIDYLPPFWQFPLDVNIVLVLVGQAAK